jgi:hypothetical protein
MRFGRNLASRWAAAAGTGQLFLAVGLVAPAMAQDRVALVVAAGGAPGDTPDMIAERREAALDLSEMLSGLGFTVRRLEDPGSDDLVTAIETLGANGGSALFHYLGPLAEESGALSLGPADAPLVLLDAAMSALSAAGRPETMVFLDSCTAQPVAMQLPPSGAEEAILPVQDSLGEEMTSAAVQPENLAEPSSAEAPRPGVFLAVAGGGEAVCDVGAEGGLTARMLERFSTPGLSLQEVFADVARPADGLDRRDQTIAVLDGLDAPFVFRPVESGMRLSAADYELLDTLSPEMREQMLALWAQAGIPVDLIGAPASPIVAAGAPIAVTSPVRAVPQTVVVTPVAPVTSGQNDAAASSPLIAAPVIAASASRPVPGTGGLPAPSIIVGLLQPAEVTEASFPAAADADVSLAPETAALSGTELSFDDPAARQSLRESNEELFISLVNSGTFDPPETELAAAVQTELQRMDCYLGAIDGAFGAGSRRALAAYYAEIDLPAPSQDPTVEVFRQTLLRDDVTCPPPPVEAAAPRAASQQPDAGAAPRQTAPAAAPAAQAPAPAPAPAPAQRGFGSNDVGTGVFR